MIEILILTARFIGIVFISIGILFFIAATVGILRMPDPYNRGHVACKGDSPGFLLCLLGVWSVLGNYLPE